MNEHVYPPTMSSGGSRESTYAWMERELAWFGVAATVVAAPGATRDQVATAYGLDLAADPETVPFDSDLGDRVSIFDTGDRNAFAVEDNGFTASLPDLIEELSAITRGRVASAFWNVNSLVKFGCADGGSLVYRGEFQFDRDGIPLELMWLVDRADERAETFVPGSSPYRLAAMEMLEAYTGLVLTQEMVRAAAEQDAYLLRRRPPLVVRGHDTSRPPQDDAGHRPPGWTPMHGGPADWLRDS
jgi:hypothetical protein